MVPLAGSLWGRWRSACPQVWGSSTAAWHCRCPEDSRQVCTAFRPPRPPCGGSEKAQINTSRLRGNDYLVILKISKYSVESVVQINFIFEILHGKVEHGTEKMWMCIFMHLTPIKAHPRLLPMGEHLPQCHPKHPGIRRMRESTRLQRLWSTPGGKWARGQRIREKWTWAMSQLGSRVGLQIYLQTQCIILIEKFSHQGKGILCPSSMMYWSVWVGSALIRPKSPIFTMSLVDSRTLRAARSLWRKRFCSR